MKKSFRFSKHERHYFYTKMHSANNRNPKVWSEQTSVMSKQTIAIYTCLCHKRTTKNIFLMYLVSTILHVCTKHVTDSEIQCHFVVWIEKRSHWVFNVLLLYGRLFDARLLVNTFFFFSLYFYIKKNCI